VYCPAGREAAFIAAWNTLSWSGTSGDWYRVFGGVAQVSPGNWYYWAERVRARQTLTFADISRSVDIYIKTGSGGLFIDRDAVGFVPGEYLLYRSDTETSDTTVVLDWISDISTCPIGQDARWGECKSTDYIRYLIKWNFEH